jgi:hypothetical protein
MSHLCQMGVFLNNSHYGFAGLQNNLQGKRQISQGENCGFFLMSLGFSKFGDGT